MQIKIKPLLFVISATLLTNSACAQKSDIGNWFIYAGNQKINDTWNLWSDVQYRHYNFAGDLQQLVLRTAVGYNLTENNNNMTAGYCFVHSQKYLPNSDEKIGTNEHRIYQQFITRQNFGRVFIQHRYRIEERFLQDDFQLRFRYFLGLNVPINNPAMAEKTIYISCYNEIFLKAASPIFDQNRLYGGLGYAISKNLRAEVGFMAQTFEKTNRNQFQIVFFNNLPFTTKKPIEQ